MASDKLCYVEDIFFHEQCVKYRTEAVYVGPAIRRQDLFRLNLLCAECKAKKQKTFQVVRVCVHIDRELIKRTAGHRRNGAFCATSKFDFFALNQFPPKKNILKI